ncbi:MAG TPA: GIY-YIG nuclease family protein [Ignavibacteriaceae bacterium]|nr:GIY-YIG nuclease family protein [Ignavibacteriaceae bacterium]
MTNKNELKKSYKQSLTQMGIYQVKNNVNGKILIGSSKNLPGIINRFQFLLKYGTEQNKGLQNDYDKYGKEKFTFEVLDELKPKEDPDYNYSEDLKVLEELWLEKLQPYGDKGYNKEIK